MSSRVPPFAITHTQEFNRSWFAGARFIASALGASSCFRNGQVAEDNFAVGHYCRICNRGRASENFSGKGHRDYVCKECQSLPRATRKHIEEVDEILGFLTQSHISANNIERLKILGESSDQEVASLASVVLEIGEIRPYKRRRLKVLAKEHKDLFERLAELELLEVMQPY